MKNFSWYQILGCVLLAVIALAAVVLLYTQTLTDNDIWFTMAYGRYFLEQGTIIPDHGIFSWTPAAGSTIYCSWIPGIAFYLLFQTLGMTSLFALRYLCLAAFILLALSFAEKKNLTSVLAGVLIILCGAVMVTSGIRIKAEIFSFVFMTVMVWTWFRIKSLQETDDRGGALFYVFPALMLIWVNSHGGFIFGLAFLGVMAVGETVNRITRSPASLGTRAMKHLFISMPLTLLAVLVTPYGWRYPGQLFSMLILNPEGYRHHFQGIFEYQNIFFPAIRHLLYIEGLAVALCILIPLALLHIRGRRPDWTILLANALFIFLYVRYIRTTYFWGILFVFTALYLLRAALKAHGGILNAKPAGAVIRSVIVCILLVLSARVLYQAWTSPDLGLRVNYYSPVAEAEYIRDTFPRITRLGNEYNSGAYLIWSLWPGKKVFIDSRYFPYATWYDEYQDFMTTPDTVRRNAFLNKYPCDLWVLNHDSPVLQHFLSSADWRLVHYGPSACVFLSGRVSHAPGHTVSESVYDTAFYQASFIARFALDVGDYQVARRLLLRLEPRPFYGFEKLYAVMALLEAGDFTLGRNEFGVARDLLARATQIDPDSYDARMMMGRVLMKMNRFEEAVQSFRETLRLQENSDEAHSRMAGALMQSHRVYEAAREYSSALKINPLNEEARTNLGVVMERMKALKTEIEQMHGAMKDRPADREGLLRLARHLAMAGQYEDALAFYRKASDLSPDDPETYYHIACMYSMLDRVDESGKWMERAMAKGFKNLSLLHRDIDLENFRKSDFYRDISKKS